MSSVQLVISQCIGKTTFNCDIQDQVYSEAKTDIKHV